MQRGCSEMKNSLELATESNNNNVELAKLISRVVTLEKENKQLKEEKGGWVWFFFVSQNYVNSLKNSFGGRHFARGRYRGGEQASERAPCCRWARPPAAAAVDGSGGREEAIAAANDWYIVYIIYFRCQKLTPKNREFNIINTIFWL